MESKGTTCASSIFASERSVSRMSYGGSSSPTPWERGSPLSPVVVVVGEGQVNLGVRPSAVSHGQSLQSFVVDLMMNQISPPDAIPVATLAVDTSEAPMGTTGVCSAYRGLLTSGKPVVEPALEHHGD